MLILSALTFLRHLVCLGVAILAISGKFCVFCSTWRILMIFGAFAGIIAPVSMPGMSVNPFDMSTVSRSEVLGRFYNPNTTPKRQREISGLPAWNWTGVALKGVLHQGD